MGHIRDLPKSKIGVDIEHGFKPDYIEMKDKKELISSLKKQAKKSDKVYLATLTRTGKAKPSPGIWPISWGWISTIRTV